MLRQLTDGLLTYHFETLPRRGLVHSVFTRQGGVSRGPFSSLNVGSRVGDDPEAVAENHRRICTHLGVGTNQITSALQVHGNRVAVVRHSSAGNVFSNTDGLVTASPHILLMLRFADCQPIVLYDPIRHALGLIHAGWRGIALGIAYRAVETMTEEFGSRSEDLWAGLGPAIGPCCYTVGNDVAAAMGYALPDWNQVMTLTDDQWQMDLPAANAQQLAAAGVQRIERAELCTACNRSEFFSHRASQGTTGRFAVVAYLEPLDDSLRGESVSRSRQEVPSHHSPSIESLSPPGMPAFDKPPGESA